jgi:hypothetical protein
MGDGVEDAAAVEEVERWFLSRGLPHFIEDYSASRDVFTRALPALILVLLLEMLGALNFAWPWWLNLVVGLGGSAAGPPSPAPTGSAPPRSGCSSSCPPPCP